jgi:hypothetical protein
VRIVCSIDVSAAKSELLPPVPAYAVGVLEAAAPARNVSKCL